MKIKKFIIAGLVILGSGLVVTGVSAANGGAKAVAYSDNELERLTANFNVDDVKKIQVETNADTLEVKAVDRSDIFINYKKLGDYGYDIKLEDGTLKIDYTSHSVGNYIFSYGYMDGYRFGSEVLVIEVPKSSLFDYLFDINASNIKVTDIEASKFDINCNAVTFNVSNTNINDLSVETSAANVSFANTTAKNVKVDVNATTFDYNGVVSSRGIFAGNASTFNMNFTDGKDKYTVNGVGSGDAIINHDTNASNVNITFQN